MYEVGRVTARGATQYSEIEIETICACVVCVLCVCVRVCVRVCVCVLTRGCLSADQVECSQAWHQFTQETSLHGLRYVTNGSRMWRR